MRTNSAILTICLLLFSQAALTQNHRIQSLASLLTQAEGFIQNQNYQSPYPVDVQFNSLDSRLRLRDCDAPLQIDFSQKDKNWGNTSLTVRCAAPVKWRIYLPVKISLYQDVLVANKALVKGQMIDSGSIRYAKTLVSNLHSGFFTHQSELKQLVVKRSINNGEVLSAANLSPQQLVRSGQQVTMILNFKGLTIKSTGTALQSAHKGQWIKVRNNQSRKIVEGVVAGEGQIRVHL